LISSEKKKKLLVCVVASEDPQRSRYWKRNSRFDYKSTGNTK